MSRKKRIITAAIALALLGGIGAAAARADTPTPPTTVYKDDSGGTLHTIYPPGSTPGTTPRPTPSPTPPGTLATPTPVPVAPRFTG